MRNNISDILGYASDAVEVAVPYFEKIGNYAGNTVRAANKRIMYAKKRAKRQMRIVKIKQWIVCWYFHLKNYYYKIHSCQQ